MKVETAELYYSNIIILCPLCEHIEGVDLSIKNALDNAVSKMIIHLAKFHTQKEARDLLGWAE